MSYMSDLAVQRMNAAVTFPQHQNFYAVIAHDESCHDDSCRFNVCEGSDREMTETGECPVCGALFCVDCGDPNAFQTYLGTDHRGLCDSCRDARGGLAPTAF